MMRTMEFFDNVKRSLIGPKKPVIFLQHGLLASADSWIINEETVAPAFALANKGYDVWLGNNRGNRFSEKHTTLDTKSREFWQFDWEEMGTEDQPAVIDFILK